MSYARNVYKAVQADALNKKAPAVRVSFPFSDYRLPFSRQYSAREVSRRLRVYLIHGKAVVRFNRVWWAIAAEVTWINGYNEQTNTFERLRHSDGSYYKAHIFFKATNSYDRFGSWK